MKYSAVRFFISGLCVIMFAMIRPAGAETDSGGLIPPDVSITGAYRPGVGAAVGAVTQVSGKVAVIHAEDSQGYWAGEGDKLFKGDTIVTLTDAYAAFKLNDGSFMTLSSETKLQISKSVYATEKKSRSTFMNMIMGKTRFIVKKLVDARHNEFKVKTATSVAGVRGSDFVVAASSQSTEVIALIDTELEVISLAAPSAEPTVLKDYEKTTVPRGALPEEVKKVSAEEVDRLMKEFKFSPSETSPGVEMEQEGGQAGADENAPLPEETYDMVIRDTDLIKPDYQVPREMIDRMSLGDRFQLKRVIRDEEKIDTQKDIITQQKFEDIRKVELPGFPDQPK